MEGSLSHHIAENLRSVKVKKNLHEARDVKEGINNMSKKHFPLKIYGGAFNCQSFNYKQSRNQYYNS